MLKFCNKLDKYGYYFLSDFVERLITAQYIQPSNNQNTPISDRVIPWRALDDDFTQRDYDRLHNDPRFREKEYIALDGVFEPGAFPADGGTSNLESGTTEDVDYKMIEKLQKMMEFDISAEDKAHIGEQIQKLKEKSKSGQYLSGNPFDMQGPDEVPGPKTAIMDHASASMVGLEGFEWKNRRFPENSTDSYKNLLPL